MSLVVVSNPGIQSRSEIDEIFPLTRILPLAVTVTVTYWRPIKVVVKATGVWGGGGETGWLRDSIIVPLLSPQLPAG